MVDKTSRSTLLDAVRRRIDVGDQEVGYSNMELELNAIDDVDYRDFSDKLNDLTYDAIDAAQSFARPLNPFDDIVDSVVDSIQDTLLDKPDWDTNGDAFGAGLKLGIGETQRSYLGAAEAIGVFDQLTGADAEEEKQKILAERLNAAQFMTLDRPFSAGAAIFGTFAGAALSDPLTYLGIGAVKKAKDLKKLTGVLSKLGNINKAVLMSKNANRVAKTLRLPQISGKALQVLQKYPKTVAAGTFLAPTVGITTLQEYMALRYERGLGMEQDVIERLTFSALAPVALIGGAVGVGYAAVKVAGKISKLRARGTVKGTDLMAIAEVEGIDKSLARAKEAGIKRIEVGDTIVNLKSKKELDNFLVEYKKVKEKIGEKSDPDTEAFKATMKLPELEDIVKSYPKDSFSKAMKVLMDEGINARDIKRHLGNMATNAYRAKLRPNLSELLPELLDDVRLKNRIKDLRKEGRLPEGRLEGQDLDTILETTPRKLEEFMHNNSIKSENPPKRNDYLEKGISKQESLDRVQVEGKPIRSEYDRLRKEFEACEGIK